MKMPRPCLRRPYTLYLDTIQVSKNHTIELIGHYRNYIGTEMPLTEVLLDKERVNKRLEHAFGKTQAFQDAQVKCYEFILRTHELGIHHDDPYPLRLKMSLSRHRYGRTKKISKLDRLIKKVKEMENEQRLLEDRPAGNVS